MKNVFRASVTAAVAATLTVLPCVGSTQSLLDSFYTNSSSAYQGNVTQAGIYQGAGLNVVTGGGFVYKVPSRTIRPLGFTPASLRGGCGGIDFLLGGFSVPSRAEFVAFLRNIGQNLPGLAFQLALASLSPDLEKQVADFRQMLMNISNNTFDSCKAARTLLDKSGATKAIETNVREVTDYLFSSGAASDATAADQQVRADGGAVRANCANIERRDADGNLVHGCDLNLTWSILSNGRWSGSDSVEFRQLVMSLLGTTVNVWSPVSGPDAKPVPRTYQFLLTPKRLLAPVSDASLSTGARWYECDETSLCLYPTEVPYADANLANRIHNAATRYRNSILTRDPTQVSPADVFLLGASTSIPLLRILNVTTYSRYRFFNEDFIAIYSEAVAYELVLRFLDDLADNASKSVAAKETDGANTQVIDHARWLMGRVKELKSDISKEEVALQNRLARASQMIAIVEHFDRSLGSNMASDLASNMRFASTVKMN